MSQTHVGPAAETTSTPRWVKVFGIIALVLLLLFIILRWSAGRWKAKKFVCRRFSYGCPA
jgi:hypothetical protein